MVGQPSGRPRLLILTPDFPPQHGGVQVLLHRLAGGLTGFRVEVVTLESPGCTRFDCESEIATKRVRTLARAQAARILALNAGALRRALRFQPHVTLSGHVVTSPAAAAVGVLAKTPCAQYVYAVEIVDKPRLSAFAAARANVVIAVSDYTASLITAAGTPAAKVRVIAPGVDLPGPQTGPPPNGRPTVLTIARLDYRYKGHDVLVDALADLRARVPDVEWVVVGDGPLRGSLEERVRAQGVAQSVRFLGAVSDEVRNTWLRRADVLAMPSRLPGEGFGIAYLEAGAYGKPVVAGNVAGPAEAVADGVTGLLVDPSDPRAVAAALERVLVDRDLAQRLGRAGAEAAAARAWPLVVQRVEQALLDLTAAT
jgi:phosphatidylinositol alpha-1,6-mannosyltransferase